MEKTKTLSSETMAQHNRDLIIRLLRQYGTMSRREIRENIEISPATLNRLTTKLLDRGVLHDDGLETSTGGRPSMRLRFNEKIGVVAVVDIRGRYMHGGVVDLRGGVLHSEDREIPQGTTAQQLRAIERLSSELLEQAHETARCLGLSISVPGAVDAEGNVRLAPALNWNDVPLKHYLKSTTNSPICVENDANTLAIAEHRYGAARGEQNLLAINLEDGIGAGIIADGKLYTGSTSSAGEIGYMLTDLSSLEKTYEHFGDLDGRLGIHVITERSRDIGLDQVQKTTVSSEEIFAMAQAGNPLALQLVDELSDELSLVVANLSAILDPTSVVLGGKLGRITETLIPKITERLTGRIPRIPQLLPPSLADDGILIGAAEHAIDATASLDLTLQNDKRSPGAAVQ